MQSGQSPKQTFVKRHKPLDMMLWKYFIVMNLSMNIYESHLCNSDRSPDNLLYSYT